ncbi:hypothetical protein [Marisediminicola sp. LYQ85]|uniref:hypothetical protein n=1 Tax=Marisediminicola sp. LYQ85 TaxID=3391062 RepID=UPI0039830907
MATPKQAQLLVRMCAQRSLRDGKTISAEQRSRAYSKALGYSHADISGLISEMSAEYTPALSDRQAEVIRGLVIQARDAGSDWTAEFNDLTSVAEADAIIKAGIAAVAAARKAVSA